MLIDAEELRSKRHKSLLTRWAEGKRLTDAELAEIADLLPKAPEPTPELQLEAQVEGCSLRKYQEGREIYAERYGQSSRTINRWMKTSAPLDHPEVMPAWWAANYKHRVPPRLLELASAPAGSDAPLPGAAASHASAPAFAAGSLTPLQQAREVADRAFGNLRVAQEARDAGAIALAQRAHQLAAEQLRRMELADPKIRALTGKVIDREKLRAVLTELHTSIAQTLRSFCKKVRAEIASRPPAEWEDVWQVEVDRLFIGFRNGEFADPVA